MIEKFFVVDFDRCLGSVGNSFDLMIKIVNDLGIVSSEELWTARNEAESKQISFSVFRYMRDKKVDIDFNVIETEYIKRAKEDPTSLRESGASEFIDYLDAEGEHYCIMSYGDPHWQAVKIAAAGYLNVPVLLVDSKHKAGIISGWYDSKLSKFTIPDSCFTDSTTRVADEVILIDDKQAAFKNLPKNIRGYWVQSGSGPTAHWVGKKHQSVQTVSRIDEIIELESSRSYS